MFETEQIIADRFATHASTAIWETKIQTAGGRCVSDERGFVVLMFDKRSSRELSEMYQDFGLLCAEGKVRWALFRTGEEDGDAHYALRDVLRTVALTVGVPLQLKLALVATSQSVARACRAMQEELRVLGCEARVFQTEDQARRWLRGAPRAALPAVNYATAIAAAPGAMPGIASG